MEIKHIAKKHNISEEQLEFIINNLYLTIKNEMRSPLDVKHGIMLNGFMKFKLNIWKIRNYVKDRVSGKAGTKNEQATLDYWIELLNKYEQYGNHERQEKP